MILIIPTILITNYLSIRKFASSQKNELLERMNTQTFFLAQYLKSSNKDPILALKSDQVFLRSPFYISMIDMDDGKLYRNHEQVIDLSQFVTSALKSKVAIAKEQGDFLVSIISIEGKRNIVLALFSESKNVDILMKESYQFLLISILVSLLVVFIISFVISKKFTSPIEKLIRATLNFSSGTYDQRIDIKGKNEFNTLARSFETMGVAILKRESQIKSMNQELMLKEKLSTLGAFSAGIAHEIKNPLGAILANTQLAIRSLKKSRLEEKELGFLKIVVDEVYRADQIIQDILSFSRQDKLNLNSIKTSDFIDLIVERQREVVLSHGHHFIVHNLVDSRIEIDQDRMIQVIGNFIENAMGALDENGEIQLTASESEKYVYLSVIDNGVGIEEENLNKIFDPFFTTKSSSKGTGLGLSLCHGIVLGHGGEIKVNTEVGVGTEFKIILPKK